MDIFSVGCVIGELFGRGEPLFDLPGVLRYRTGDTNELDMGISKLEDPVAQEMVKVSGLKTDTHRLQII